MTELNIRNNTHNQQWEAKEGDEILGVAHYATQGQTMVFTHTEVKPERRGQNVGSTLVEAAVSDARRQGFTIDPKCPFVARFLQANPKS